MKVFLSWVRDLISKALGPNLVPRQVQLSWRLKLTVFSGRDGETRKLLLERVRGQLGSLSGLDNLESIGVSFLGHDFRQLLSPFPPNYSKRYGSFIWRWSSDGKFLTADNSEQCFEMTAYEASLLEMELFPDNERLAEEEN